MPVNHQNFGTISWKSYQLIRKKAMEQELSWSGLIVSLSIAFFVTVACAGFLRLTYNSIEKNSDSTQRYNSERLIQSGYLAKLFVNSVSAATLDLKATPVKDTIYLNLVSGQTSSQKITLKNIGKDSWKTGEVTVETGPSLKKASRLESPSWLKFYRPVNLPKEVKSGQSIEISFPVKAPTDIEGTFQENFQLVRNEQPIKGSLVRFFVTISKSSPVKVTSQPQIKSVSSTAPSFKSAQSVQPAVPLVSSITIESSFESGIFLKQLLNSEPNIRVGLYNSTIDQHISYNTAVDIYGGSEILFSAVPANSSVLVNYNPVSRRYAVSLADMVKYTASPVRLVPRDQYSVATLADSKSTDNRFRGVIEIRYTEPAKKVWVINELPIESYLKGLAETTNASPLEFQKVMATTARSYAMYHYLRGVQFNLIDASTKHADDHFHIDAYYDQVYRGYNSELRMPGLSAAIDATRGITVTYGGKPVVTPYFSNSDGRTRAWTEVWGGSVMPWLVSVLVPQDNGKNLFGHGVGMSARGALLMASSGTSWQNVLKYFYTGIDLLKIY